MTRRQIENSPLLYLSASLVTLTAFSGLILSSFPVSADNDTAIDEINISVPSSCSISGGNTFNISMDPDTYEEVGPSNITAYCNDQEGFAIYAKGTSSVDETDGNNAKLIGQTVTNKIATGTATSGSTSNWAMKLTLPTGTPTYPATIVNGYNAYSAVPTDWTKVISRNSGTDIGTNAEGSSFSAYYAIFISGTQVPDTYSGQVTYALVHPATADAPTSPETTASGKICYYPNGQNVVGTMGCQTVSTSATSITLLASNFSREGYGFAGWSDVNDYTTNPNAHFYGPQEDITFTAGQYTSPNNGLSLYAVWVKSEGSLQDSNRVSSVCNRLSQSGPNVTRTINSVSALTDLRDNETYAIAKLADGNCWMIENLRLENTNSDNSTGALAQGYGTSATYGNFSGLANPENNNFTATTTSTDPTEPNSLYYAGTQSGTATINISQTNYAGYRMPRYNNYNHQTTSANRPQNPTRNDATNSTTSAGMYSYGNYYTWAAAMANTGHYNTTTADANGYTPSEAAGTSICPKGWKLPYGRNIGKGATSGGFSYLDIQLGGTGINSTSSTTPTSEVMSKAWRSYPNNFLNSGIFNISSVASWSNSGYYWSSSADSDHISYQLLLSADHFYPGTNTYLNNKYSGYSIRCVASGA